MKNKIVKISDLIGVDGKIGRVTYAIWGLLLFSIKYLIDGLMSNLVFQRRWSITNYVVPGRGIDILSLTPEDKIFFGCLLITALPFIWAGIVLTLKRLRAANLPIWLVKLFFLPFVNFIFFAVLCLYPNQEDVTFKDPLPGESPQSPQGTPPAQSSYSDFISAVLTPLPLAVLMTFFGVSALRTYGWGLFVGIPFVTGMTAAYMLGRGSPRTFWQCLLAAFASTGLLGLGIFFMAWEGLICLIMAAPIALAIAAIGAALGYQLQKRKLPPGQDKYSLLILVMLFPLLMGAESEASPIAPQIAVTTIVTIPAPPETVWKNVIAFPKLPDPEELIFRTGIAYPIGAIINGHGPGAVRKCQFSTGAFIEPITIWDEPNLLSFGVKAQPPSMNETSYLKEIHPAHLEGYLVVENGQFRLTPVTLPDGRIGTRLEGTTRYRNKMWPASYWRLWSDHIIHNIHMRVLKHIAQLSISGSKAIN